MKVLELHLAAFGPFTDFRLDFQEAGLHILYGPNEVGKSSALRALKAWLFGVPHNSTDNFLHGNPSLRVGGRLRHSDGTELAFYRRKGHKDTLLDLGGRPLDDSILAQFLGSVGEQLFSTVFAIDHAELVRGGQEILQGGGEVGQALFAAGMGGAGLQQILQDLEEEATSLFRPRGQTQVINKALAEHNELKRTITSVSLPGRQWSEYKEALDRALAEQEDAREGLRHRIHEKTRFERLQTVLPKIAKRKEHLAKLQTFGNVVILPPGFADTRREADRRLETALESEKQTSMDIDRLRKGIQVLNHGYE